MELKKYLHQNVIQSDTDELILPKQFDQMGKAAIDAAIKEVGLHWFVLL